MLFIQTAMQLKDRSKDIIISGGENISSIEIEDILHNHEDIVAVAVVAMPHEKWGETPCAFVELTEGKTISDADLTAWCKDRMASYKVPRKFIFEAIPKTSTGKSRNFCYDKKYLNARAWTRLNQCGHALV